MAARAPRDKDRPLRCAARGIAVGGGHSDTRHRDRPRPQSGWDGAWRENSAPAPQSSGRSAPAVRPRARRAPGARQCPAVRGCSPRRTCCAVTTTENGTPIASKWRFPQFTLSAPGVRSFVKSIVLLVSFTRYSVACPSSLRIARSEFVPADRRIDDKPARQLHEELDA